MSDAISITSSDKKGIFTVTAMSDAFFVTLSDEKGIFMVKSATMADLQLMSQTKQPLHDRFTFYTKISEEDTKTPYPH